ncbi:MAG: dTDP-glucose 4,6-dehydratase [Deltaproteobacteria bacterium]|jgi:dTDP-glucose 4,6-dehydratase|nr:dTDP-glucose 4,6-dehydratase [Deltaproteobacteria bacterium]
MTILITGGAGFIGSNFILDWAAGSNEKIINLDKMTYAGNPDNLFHLNPEVYELVVGDICDPETVKNILEKHKPRAILNLAAESHVDRSIYAPAEFMTTNVMGTFNLLESSRAYYDTLTGPQKDRFRFLHVSTDEVFGSLEPADPPFSEESPYRPNSPYSASKAAADHLVRAYFKTYNLPVLTTNCSNNYGPRQFPEKFIPLLILNAAYGHSLPIYGDGLQVRDWIYVTDHCTAIRNVLQFGQPGETYNIGGQAEKNNLDVARAICQIIDQERPRDDGQSHAIQITHVTDRPGHDRRYAICGIKIDRKLGFTPRWSFEEGLAMTVDWYLNNPKWVERVRSGTYREWLDLHYGQKAPESQEKKL